MRIHKPLLVGELNPYGSDPYFALYPKPDESAGGRLCHRVLGYPFAYEYLRVWDRANLCSGRWTLEAARLAARAIVEEAGPDARPIVLLGQKVAHAFDVAFLPCMVVSGFLVLWHPSGRNRAWNEAGAYLRARDAVVSYLGRYCE